MSAQVHMPGFDPMSMLQHNLLSMIALKNDSTFDQIIWAMVMMSLLGFVMNGIKELSEFVKARLSEFWNHKKQKLSEVVQSAQIVPGIATETASILYHRHYQLGDASMYEVSDALLDFLSGHNQVKFLTFNKYYFIHNFNEFEIDENVKCKLLSFQKDESECVVSVQFRIFSTNMKLSELRKWVENIHKNYVKQKNNKLGATRLYFDEIPVFPPPDPHGSGFRMAAAPKTLLFNLTPFSTSKSLSNLYGEGIESAYKKIERFIRQPSWYSERGIPYTLGILLYGEPGCGKTSLIKAVAKDTNRHIFNLSLRETTTKTQLKNLFYTEQVSVQDYSGQGTVYTIPMNERIIVIEDIDCLTDVVLDRKLQEQKQQQKKDLDAYKKKQEEQTDSEDPLWNTLTDIYGKQEKTKSKTIEKLEGQLNEEKITLSFLLNLLDGILETPGRILIITSNYPEKLDSAFIRPGRIDIKIQMGRASVHTCRKMIENIYDLQKCDWDLPESLDRKYTPAEFLELLTRYCDDHTELKEVLGIPKLSSL